MHYCTKIYYEKYLYLFEFIECISIENRKEGENIVASYHEPTHLHYYLSYRYHISCYIHDGHSDKAFLYATEA